MKNFTFWIKEKLWVTPAVYSIFAVALSIIFFYIDLYLIESLSEYIPSILLTNVDLAKTIMGNLSGALLTMTTFTFSTILVVLTMYSSQFSPRTLKNFVHDRLTWRVLGVFLGGFIYNTLSLLFMRAHLYSHDVISTFIGIVIAFFCLATFAYFIHHISTTVQVGKLVIDLIGDTERVIKKFEGLWEKSSDEGTIWRPDGIKRSFAAGKAGFIGYIYFEELLEYAEKNNMEVEVLVSIGDYIHETKSIVNVYMADSEEFPINEYFIIGEERTSEQDVEFALQKLVEISLRAISPGINDPNTANDIVIRLGNLLGKIGSLKTDEVVLTDKKGNGRILYPYPKFREILYKVYYQFSYYGKDDISVLGALTDSLIITSETVPEKHKNDLWDIQLYILEGVAAKDLKSMDRIFLQKKIDILAERVNKRAVNLLDINGN
ncbi:DUF2254 domain-containing protein [Planomicrobium okeanokoites]|uniref:DUF2254 domain-containing protein n=2 Tax=Planomicrobium okeanokoites TaxID=244 RepID=A0ABV7KM28_PLAOK|nr:DUF2254 domain-containing protein [Planomicrobium okeanokoites]TAA67834.1 DUF2254 domain-containing protein [Planomicrobium okeanokoites]